MPRGRGPAPAAPAAPNSLYPRGSAGCVLYPGTVVRIHGLRSDSSLNGVEGLCQEWNTDLHRMHVQLQDGSMKAVKPMNLRKVSNREEHTDKEMNRILEIFQSFDKDGDGIIEREELEDMMKTLGMGNSLIPTFLHAMDKDGDFEVRYEEFLDWAMESPDKSKKTRREIYWPDRRPTTDWDKNKVGADDEELEDERELCVDDLERLCGPLAHDWPDHGLTVVNNVHARFPDYPVEGIIMFMREHNFIGGKVIAAVRRTGAKELEVIPPSAVRVGAKKTFPAQYRVRDPHRAMQVYQQKDKSWSFQKLRDGKLPATTEFPAMSQFTLLEVRRGNEYGFCFGRVKMISDIPHWVNLGLELDRHSVWHASDSDRRNIDLNFTEAERLSA